MLNSSINGVGLGLRGPHLPEILASHDNDEQQVPWFEVLADNYLGSHGLMAQQLELIRNDYPITFHCVGMSLGSIDALNQPYFDLLNELINRYQPAWVSDHVSFSHFNGEHFHDLLPLPYTEESLKHFVQRTLEAQDKLGRTLLLENPSTYVRFNHSTIDEADFMNELAKQTGCGLLIDINNCYVNAINHDESAKQFLNTINPKHVKEIHLGGHEDRGDYLLDAHNSPISESVWQLYEKNISRFNYAATLIEWDNDLPDYRTLISEREHADLIYTEHAKACA